MALSATVLAAAIRSKLLADDASHAVDNLALTALCKAVAEACVEHITSAGIVNSLGLLAPPGTAGGPVTGASTIS